MDTNKMAIGFLFIVITILALIVMINLSWKSISKKCWLDLNGSKKDILSSLETCIENCWSKHDFGEDTVTSDCYVINVFSNDRNIKKEDVESLKEYTKCYFEDDLLANIPYRIKVRYNYTGREVSIINWGLCGNNVLERGEFCDGNADICGNRNLYGECTDSSILCEDCKCKFLVNCEKCKNGRPNTANPNTNTDWCKYCKSIKEIFCTNSYDDDCDGKIDQNDEDCHAGNIIFSCGLGNVGCPRNSCLANKEKNGVKYPNCPNNIKIINTNPARQDSCDSPKCMYDFIHDPSFPYINVYDVNKRDELKKEIESQLVTIDFLGSKITVNKKVAGKFMEVQEKLNKYPHSGSTYVFPSGTYTFINSGSYNFRYNVNNPSVLSAHAFGLAIDLNAQTNWGNVLDNDPCDNPSCIMDIPPEVVEAFESSGFRWGGRFWCSFDPMHFEYIPSCIVT